MSRRRTIVGLGEAILLERPDRSFPVGLAAHVAVRAVRMGHTGVIVSRIGQDAAGDEFIGLLEAVGVDTTCVQRDPDLPTARAIERPGGRRFERYADEPAAFDNLQSDFDLEDVAQQADVVVHGLLTRRSGQTRSEEDRFVAACGAALKVFDLTNRLGAPDRGYVLSGMASTDVLVLDEASLRAVRPGAPAAFGEDVARDVLRGGATTLVYHAAGADDHGAETNLIVHDADGRGELVVPGGRAVLASALLMLTDGALRGIERATTLDAMQRAARFASEHPDEPLPAELTTTRASET